MSPGGDRYPLLRNVHIDNHRKPLREPDSDWVAQLAEGIRSGHQMKPIGIEACPDGGWHVTYAYHTYLAVEAVHGGDPKQTIRATECHYNSKVEHILDQAKDNNIKPFTEEEWRGLIEQLLESGMSQTQIASKIGRSKSWVTMKLNPEKYEDRPNGRVYALNGPSEKDRSDLMPVNPPTKHEFTSPLDPTLDPLPEISTETGRSSAAQTHPAFHTPALVDSKGAMGARTQTHLIPGSAPSPSFLSKFDVSFHVIMDLLEEDELEPLSLSVAKATHTKLLLLQQHNQDAIEYLSAKIDSDGKPMVRLIRKARPMKYDEGERVEFTGASGKLLTGIIVGRPGGKYRIHPDESPKGHFEMVTVDAILGRRKVSA